METEKDKADDKSFGHTAALMLKTLNVRRTLELHDGAPSRFMEAKESTNAKIVNPHKKIPLVKYRLIAFI